MIKQLFIIFLAIGFIVLGFIIFFLEAMTTGIPILSYILLPVIAVYEIFFGSDGRVTFVETLIVLSSTFLLNYIIIRTFIKYKNIKF